MNIDTNQDKPIDQNLYSRQIGAYGMETMVKLVKTKVLILGVSGVGLELCKNLILAGPNSVVIWDNEISTENDLEWNYYLNKNDIGKLAKSLSVITHLQELNSYVNVHVSNKNSLHDFCLQENIKDFDVVVATQLYPLEILENINKICNQNNKAFLSVSVSGLFGHVFSDFGNQHFVNDPNGEPKIMALVTGITNEGIVYTEDKQHHGFYEGDSITFKEVVGMENINGKNYKIKKVISPYCFQIEHFQPQGTYIRNGYVEEVKLPQLTKSKSLKEVLENPQSDLIDCDMDFSNMDKMHQLKSVLCQLWKYSEKKLIKNFFQENQEFLIDLDLQVKEDYKKYAHICGMQPDQQQLQNWLQNSKEKIGKFAFAFSKGNFLSAISFFGAIAAQEIIKITGKFTPLNNIFIHEFYTGLFKHKSFEEVYIERKELLENQSRNSHEFLLGKKLFEKMKKSKALLVGSGALGCEYLKILSKSGICTEENSQLVVVDDDQIELSNLNRQFLFRNQHIGKPKAEISSSVAKNFNENFKVVPVVGRMQSDQENVFTDVFWDSLDIVINAVDNIKAWKYVDQKVVLHQKPLFESGTLGTKCNSQLILPGLTESYQDSQDPEDKSTPMCTIRSFPYLIDHCIEWAREKFSDIFVKPSQVFREFREEPEKAQRNFEEQLIHDLNRLVAQKETLKMYIDLISCPSLEEYIKIGVFLYQEFFEYKIIELLTLFPADYVDKEGRLFWTSPKRPPIVLPFDKENQEHQNFVITVVKILNQMLPMQFSCNKEQIVSKLKEMKIHRKKTMQREINKEDLLDESKQGVPQSTEEDLQEMNKLLEEIISAVGKAKEIKEIEFEKDDDQNGHIDFITFYSNFWAENYSINKLPFHEIKIKAGKIIPAIATSTAMICGQVFIEVCKYFLQVPFEQYRNFFANLAINAYSFSEPIGPLVQKDKAYDVVAMGPVKTMPKNWNTWSWVEVQGPKTIKEIIEDVKQWFGFTISTMRIQNSDVYVSFLPKLKQNAEKSMEQILKEIGREIYQGKLYEILFVTGEDSEGVDILPPFIQYRI